LFDLLFFNLRNVGIKVGLGEWIDFLTAINDGLVVDLGGLYRFGRALLVHTERQYDDWDRAFEATFSGVTLPPELSEELAEWVAGANPFMGDRVPMNVDEAELWEKFLERMREQKERHDGGGKWIGTGGVSPFGSGGRSAGGIRVGQGGGRSALAVAGERKWRGYRADKKLEHRDFKVALRALRSLVREGQLELDIDETIDRTGKNAGDVDLVFQRARKNRVHLVLIMDTGGSMTPHARLASQLFTAASEVGGFKSFESYYFHNAVYGELFEDEDIMQPVSLDSVMRGWTAAHRVILVGDASMAPYELMSEWGGARWGASGWERSTVTGLDWFKRIKRRCPASVWLNPDAQKYWEHPTVSAIGRVFPMLPLSIAGVQDAVKILRLAGQG